MQIKTTVKTLIMCCFLITFNTTHSQTLDCSKRPTVPSENQRIRELIYDNVEALKESSVGKDTKKINAFMVKYNNLRTDFNALFNSMKMDRQNFANYRTLCTRYNGQLQSLIKRAQNYNSEIETTLGEQVASLGVDDVTNILDWLLKQKEGGVEKFYTQLAWKKWSDIGKENEASSTAEKESSGAVKDKKPTGKTNSTKRS